MKRSATDEHRLLKEKGKQDNIKHVYSQLIIFLEQLHYSADKPIKTTQNIRNCKIFP